MPLFISLFFSHLIPFYSSVYQSLTTCPFLFLCFSVICVPCLFFCLLVIIYTFLFNIMFISHYLHAPFYSAVFQSSNSLLFFCLSVINHMPLFIPLFLSHLIPFCSSVYQSLTTRSFLFLCFQSSAFPLSSSVYQSLSTRSFLFLCLSVIICTLLFNSLFISHYLHIPF
jgi:hypothetical protein